MWSAENDKRKKAPKAIPAPKLPLPGHAESYNPPAEYLMTEEEKKEWDQAPQPMPFGQHVLKAGKCVRQF